MLLKTLINLGLCVSLTSTVWASSINVEAELDSLTAGTADGIQVTGWATPVTPDYIVLDPIGDETKSMASETTKDSVMEQSPKKGSVGGGGSQEVATPAPAQKTASQAQVSTSSGGGSGVAIVAQPEQAMSQITEDPVVAATPGHTAAPEEQSIMPTPETWTGNISDTLQHLVRKKVGSRSTPNTQSTSAGESESTESNETIDTVQPEITTTLAPMAAKPAAPTDRQAVWNTLAALMLAVSAISWLIFHYYLTPIHHAKRKKNR